MANNQKAILNNKVSYRKQIACQHSWSTV